MNIDRNTIVGTALMIFLVLGYVWLQTPSAAEKKEQARLDSLEQVQMQQAAAQAGELHARESQVAAADTTTPQEPVVNADQYGIFAASAAGEEKTITVETDVMTVRFSTRGGLVKGVTLKDHVDYTDSTQIDLWDEDWSKMFVLLNIAGKGAFATDHFIFTPGSENVDATSEPAQLTMTLRTSDPSKYLQFVYGFTPGSHQVAVQMNAVNLRDELQLSTNRPEFYWQAAGWNNELGLAQERQHSSVFYKTTEEDRDFLSEMHDEGRQVQGKLQWMAFKQFFFTAAVYSDQGFGEKAEFHNIAPQDSVHNKQYVARFDLNVPAESSASTAWNFYFGPNKYAPLKETGAPEFVRIIDYGWGIIGWVSRWIIRPIFEFLSSYIGAIWVVILLLTLAIKTILFPVTWKNFVSSAKMRILKPEMDELNKKYEGKDAVEKQQAIMALYKQTGVNPFAGCVPVLFQMPILYAMFRFFPSNIELRGQNFLWANDLANYDILFKLPFEIPFYGAHVSGLTILMCISTYFYSKMTMGATPAPSQPGMPNMKVIMNIFTFMMLFFFNSMSSGLTLYYFVANITSIGQMWVIKKYIVDEKKLRDKIDNNKKKPVKKSSFQQKLEEMQKAQKDKQKQLKSQIKK